MKIQPVELRAKVAPDLTAAQRETPAARNRGSHTASVESFAIGRDGRISYKLVGPITPESLDQVLRPAIEKALEAPAPPS